MQEEGCAVGELVERAEGILNQVAANASDGAATPEAFAAKIATSYPDMVRPILASWAALMFDMNSAKAEPEKPAANEREPRAIQDVPLATERATIKIVASDKAVSRPRDEAARKESLPSVLVPPVSRPAPNAPRVPVSAIASANQRLGQSLLDAWQVGGKKFGDCRVSEIVDACNSRDRATYLMRAVVKDLPGNAIVRHVLDPQQAENRRKAAAITLTQQPTTIEAAEPEGYSHVG